jgi:ribonuclease P protein component
MKRRFRLRSNQEFQRVRREGHSWSHPLLVLSAHANGLPFSRFGFSVSRRIGKATARNRARRRMREAVRRRMDTILPSRDVVFIARAPIREANSRQVEHAIEVLLAKANLLRHAQ